MAPGDRVRHRVFGEGVVTAVSKTGAMTIRFEKLATPRTLMPGAPLEKVFAEEEPLVEERNRRANPNLS